ncbi:MAG TPA: DsbA family protein [Pseudolabrys sp.]|jgi:protein-disulfide isomerase|nr:DsbA family protein [Pseudolabrys sp.]
MVFALPPTSHAAEFSKTQTGEIQKIVHDYLVEHPEVIEEAIQTLQQRQQAAEDAKSRAAVQAHAKQLDSAPDHVVLGNPNGNVTFVEFFDYNCGYCKHAMGDMLTLMKSDPNLKVLLKEYPVLGEGSVEAAKVAVAVRMQAPKRYLEFHTKLLGGRGHADEARALAVAKSMGLDMARIRKDMNSADAKKMINTDYALGRALGLNGTPSYVIGDNVVVGAVGIDALKQKIANARCGKNSC